MVTMRAFFALATLSLAALGCGSGATQFQFAFSEQRAQLGNGLRVVVLPDKNTELVEVDVRYNVGSSSDPEGKAGLAHLVEHLMFLQRPEGPGSPPLSRYINQVVTSFNAYTTWDSTHYMMQGRRENLDSMLQIEAMRLFYGCRTLPEAEFAREREVVRNEIRQRTGTPEGQIPQLLLSAVYPEKHAYSRMIGGNDEQLASITLQDACAFMATYYVPSNATLVVAGNVTRDDLIPMVTKWFGQLPARPARATARVTPLTLQRQRVEHTVDVERPWLYAVWALPPLNTREGELANFAVGLVGSWVARFAVDWPFAARVVATPDLGGQLAPVFMIGVELLDESRRDQALDFIMKAARRAHWGTDQDSFNEGHRARARARFVMGLEPLASRTNLLGDLAQFHKGIAWDASEQLWEQRFRTSDDLDGDELSSLLQHILDPDKAVIVDIKASEAGIRGDRRASGGLQSRSHDSDHEVMEIDPQEAHRALQVPRRTNLLGQATRFQLGNGMKVVLLSFSAMPVVSAILTFNAGAAQEPREQAGLAQLAANMIRSNSATLLFIDYGIAIGEQVDEDTTTFVARTISEPTYLESLIKGLERHVKAGQYPQENLEKWQERRKPFLESMRYQERTELQTQLYATIFGPEHPYTTQGPETLESLGKLNRDAVMGFKDKHYSARNATLVLAGQFDVAQAEKYIRDHFGDWGGGHADTPVPATQRTRTGPEFIGVIADAGPQMAVRIAYPAPGGYDDQRAARLVLERMLGERMSRIRQQLGSTYGVYARRRDQTGPTMYEIGGQVDAKRAGESLAVMRANINLLRQGYPGFDADFVRARRRVIETMLGRSTVSLNMAGRLTVIERHGLGVDYFDRLLEQVASVTPSQVKQLIAAELRPETEVVVCMADRATLEGAFRQAHLDNAKFVEPGK